MTLHLRWCYHAKALTFKLLHTEFLKLISEAGLPNSFAWPEGTIHASVLYFDTSLQLYRYNTA